MASVRISPKFQVVIPKEVREATGLRPGTRAEIFLYENRIELVPIEPVRRLRGFLKGIDTRIRRDKDRV